MLLAKYYHIFSEKFDTNEKCLTFLYYLKWGKGYTCVKCGSNSSRIGNTRFHKRCQMCDYEESVTSNTVFHNIKFPLYKAFYIIYRIRKTTKNVTALKLMVETMMSIATVSKFKKKVLSYNKELIIRPEDVNTDNFLSGLI